MKYCPKLNLYKVEVFHDQKQDLLSIASIFDNNEPEYIYQKGNEDSLVTKCPYLL